MVNHLVHHIPLTCGAVGGGDGGGDVVGGVGLLAYCCAGGQMKAGKGKIRLQINSAFTRRE